jgi:hypothetical protein
MHVVRFDQAPAYHPPGHDGMRCLRLQGHEAGPASRFWLGASVVEPGGSIQPSASPLEKMYVVLEGEIVITTPDGEVTLRKWDSCRLAENETRAVENRSGERAVVLLSMALG